ncbi:Seven transmembrane protein 1 [Spironucleus salmonicida]|uniref:PQ-loop motif-containing protein n=1 Tax=Spironucleus salmonicida TaxID=348837 RepID=V6LCC7_9EUKA|nr:Seven transmembrane protein 1 [Spironucleus salmonicida]|eukprot:EST41311.1 PQ-loop motif-containing protein [Spironucleus salmonicida]
MPCRCAKHDGDDANAFINAAFGDCKYNNLDYAQFIFGWLSLFCWVVANYPQIREQYLIKSSGGMSWGFILFLVSGDTLNLVSVFVLDLLFTQRILAAIWISMDIVMIFQQIFYSKKTPISRSIKVNLQEGIIYGMIFAYVISLLITIGVLQGQLFTSTTGVFTECSTPVISKTRNIIGLVLGYATVPFYCLTRPFQIALNYKRKSVEGLSVVMFCITIAANVTQLSQLCLSTASIYIFDSANISSSYDQIPYFLAAFVPVSLDVVILCQFYYYTKVYKKPESVESPVHENALEDGADE